MLFRGHLKGLPHVRGNKRHAGDKGVMDALGG